MEGQYHLATGHDGKNLSNAMKIKTGNMESKYAGKSGENSGRGPWTATAPGGGHGRTARKSDRKACKGLYLLNKHAAGIRRGEEGMENLATRFSGGGGKANTMDKGERITVDAGNLLGQG